MVAALSWQVFAEHLASFLPGANPHQRAGIRLALHPKD
jgi:hypothetical protein